VSNHSTLEMTGIYERYGFVIFRQARRILGNEEEAWDATQDVLVKVLRGLAGFRQESSLFTWIYRITTNHCLNLLKQRRSAVLEELLEGNLSDPQAHGPEHEVLVDELLQVILGRFDRTTQEIVYYYHVDELPQEKIAEMLNVSRKTVYNKLERFKARCAKITSRLRREA